MAEKILSQQMAKFRNINFKYKNYYKGGVTWKNIDIG